MLTFFLYILPIIIVVFCHVFYTKYINKDKSYTFINRLARLAILLMSLVPVLGWFSAVVWIYIFFDSDTTFKSNKITDFFINN